MNNSLDFRRRNAHRARKLGYTLLEIMTSVTLALMLMYSVARIYSRVGGEMNETMSTMGMTNALRNAKDRLVEDLNGLTVSPEPPSNSRLNEGYLCYIEGMGGPFNRIAANGGKPFSTSAIALDSERFDAYNNADFNSDNTVGDLDDIISFTSKAPAGQPFRGRYVKPVYDAAGNLVDGEVAVFESQYAEIVWFVRGTTLYRRVLPIMSDHELQASFAALQMAAAGTDATLGGVAYENVRKGFGFYYLYDVSVHMGENGYLVANSLGDLSNRKNRYFYWNSCGTHAHPDNAAVTINPLEIHGSQAAWYWLRMATLQESAAPNFRAGAPFGEHSKARDPLLLPPGSLYETAARQLYGDPAQFSIADRVVDFWEGSGQELTFINNAGSSPLTGGSYPAATLPILNQPFIDYWNSPNVWDEDNDETGDLGNTTKDLKSNANSEKIFTQDVILTNVLSFNVKVWDKNCNAYVDLGACDNQYDADGNFVMHNDPNDFRSYGRYGDRPYTIPYSPTEQLYDLDHIFPWLPCVYDTWSEQYQRDLCLCKELGNHLNLYLNPTTPVPLSTGTVSDIPAEGKIASSQLKDYPPPYDQRADSIQIEMRVFDPRSKRIRNATFNVDLSSK
ncbi:MAG: hypothetical protein PHO46_07415 [Thermoguttaceae bacterium]|nr:hypothetical protein [Thermoguttaceae bacterium]